MNKKQMHNLFAFALISFVSLSAMEKGEIHSNNPDDITQNDKERHKEATRTFLCNAVILGAYYKDEAAINLVSILGISIDTVNDCGITMLGQAAYLDCGKIADFLIKQGADVNLKDEHGHTIATLHGHETIVSLLLKEGASLDIQDEWGKTPCDYPNEKIKKIMQPYTKAQKLKAKKAQRHKRVKMH